MFQSSTIEYVRLPSTLRSIEYNAFRNCKNLKALQLGENIVMLGRGCFYGSGLMEVTLSRGITEIPNQAFCKCASLARV